MAIDTSTRRRSTASASTATDSDGNEATLTHFYTVVSHPAVELTVPADGASYGQGTKVQAVYSCSEPNGGPGNRDVRREPSEPAF